MRTRKTSGPQPFSREDYRQVLGDRLREFRESIGKSKYATAIDGNIASQQVTTVEKGDANYSIDVLMGYLKGVGLHEGFMDRLLERPDSASEEERL
jgi:transcriptional regulator with XRE-family HTH domain